MSLDRTLLGGKVDSHWQKWGTGVYAENYEKVSWDPSKEKEIVTQRRRLIVEYDLPIRDGYNDFIKGFLGTLCPVGGELSSFSYQLNKRSINTPIPSSEMPNTT